ncbi:MAG: DNA mismatch repair endonuclease MutL [Bacilli bacterium]|nr:DNA mismatch repair endonuclease MutL [Bacilli bacterium]
MPKIKVMSENLANKIAAGEVIEKCASVVKEIVENSIDANSDNIKVELENGGLTSIKVTDNGIGMESEDALLAFQRHATSKLLREDDLFFIDTLGFRGEALPSIASVSEVDLITCASKVGTHIHIKGGKLELNEPSDARKGTIITVSNLFYNTPARLKYLKSEQYELSQIVYFIEKLALSYPNIKFELSNNDKIIVKTSGSGNLLKTIHEVYGLQVSSKMVEIKASNDDFTISGYICKPEILRSNRNDMNIFVNGRLIKNYDINKSINDAYYNYKPEKKYPIVVISIETDPTLIDVNIHPTKQDIKIAKYEELNQLINKTISDILHKELLVQDASLRLSPTNEVKEELLTPEIKEEEIPYIPQEEVVEEPKEEPKIQQTFDFTTDDEDKVVNPEMKKLELYPIGQIHGTFIVAENDNGMFLIDQHAAAERVNYEKIKKQFQEKDYYQVNMLIPITLEYPTSDFIKLKENFEYLKELGFGIEEFGLNTINITSHPSWINENYAEETIRAILEMIINDKSKFDPVKFEERLIQTTACKMSIVANTKMSQEEMEDLLKQLALCDNPYNCAHGRPSIMKFRNYELDRMFKRAMN